MIFNDFFCVAKHIKRISINVVKHVVIRSFISYLLLPSDQQDREWEQFQIQFWRLLDEFCETSEACGFLLADKGVSWARKRRLIWFAFRSVLFDDLMG